MKTLKHRRIFAALGALLGSVVPSVAGAQEAAGWALDRYEPTTVGDVFFMAEHPWYSSTRTFAVGIIGDYAANPLVLRQEFSAADGTVTSRTTNIVSGQFVGHLGLAVSFLDRVGLGLSLPLSFVQTGTASPPGLSNLGPASGVGIGDLRVGARLRLVGHADRDGVSLHLGANLWVPLDSRANNTTDGRVRFEPRLTLAGRGGIVRWSAGAALQLRGNIDAANLAIGNELRFTAALGFVALDDNLTIGPEAYVFTAVRDLPTGRGSGSAAFQTGQWGAEVMLGAHYLIGDTIMVGLGGGIGLERGYGIPAGRGLLSIAYAPVDRAAPPGPGDRDHDGVLDPDDLCIDVPQGPNPDPTRRGCPLLDTDGDGVFDRDDICVTVPMGAHPDPTRRGCPDPDTDGDGVFDREDVCVTTPMGPTPHPDRRGCPDGDRDHDTVLDHTDVCPDEHRGLRPDPAPARIGCPLPAVVNPYVEIGPCGITIATPIFFDTDRAIILPRSNAILTRLAQAVIEARGIRRFRIEGHTDDRGGEAHNLALSESRAIAVRRWLADHGVEDSRMEAQGFGMSRPIALNTTIRGRASNRRVEFVILDPAPTENCAARAPAAGLVDPGETRDTNSRRNRRPAPAPAPRR